MSKDLERELMWLVQGPDGRSGSECGGIAGDMAQWEFGLWMPPDWQ